MDCLLNEDQVKQFLNNYYLAQGYKTTVAWGHKPGADIIAEKGNERLVIEVKGCGSRQQMRENYFLAIIGELLKRMDRSDAEYFISFPKMKQYENLCSRLPALAKQRTQIRMILVDDNGRLEIFE